MYRLRPANLLATILGTAALLASSLAPIAVGPVVADHGGGRATATATLACSGNAGLPTDACVNVNHESPPGVHAWSVTDARTVNAGGSSMTANPEFSFDETYDGNSLVRAVIKGHMTVSLRGGGAATADANYWSEFVPIAGSYSVSGQLTFTAGGSGLINSSGGVRLNLRCGTDDLEVEVSNSAGAGEPLTVASTEPVSATVTTGDSACVLEVSLSAGTGTNRPAPASEAGSADAELEVTITSSAGPSPTPPPCSLSGNVSDTGGVERAGNPLAGVKLELLASAAGGGQALVPPVAAGPNGEYCFVLPAGPPSGDAILRATLIDWTHTPPMLETRHGSDTEAVSTERAVEAGDFGRDDFGIAFTPTDGRVWLPEVAAIHYESERFMRWIWDVAGFAPGLIGPVTVVTDDAGGTRYNPPSQTAFIDATDTRYADRSGPETECPEACEWHELAHHVGDAGGIADIGSGACDDREPHGGRLNGTTCDSLTEGFAQFLATFASLDIDENAEFGYGTAQYSDRANLQENGFAPWTTEVGQGGSTVHREGFAVAQLLWDLADGQIDESEEIAVEGGPAGLDLLRVHDRVAIGGPELVHLMFDARPETVVELYDALVASATVPASLKAADPAMPPSLPVALTPLQQVFLLHRFHPVHDDTAPQYRFGDAIPYTDHVAGESGDLRQRPTDIALPGSAIRLVNPSGSDVTFSIDVTYPSTKTQFRIVVAAGSERVIHLEVPPPWSQVVAAGDPLPECGASGPRIVTISVSTPGAPPQSIDNCAYLHAVATTTTGYAITVSAAGGAGAADMTTLLVVGIGAAALLAIIGGLLLARRRVAGGATPPST